MSISAIVPVWNRRDLLEKLLDSLDSQTQPAAEVLVIDNGSSDGAPQLAASRGARVIAMGRNMGFAAAVNRGIREARGEWIAVLNSDVELAPDYFAILTATTAWFATGKILMAGADQYIDGTFDAVCRGGTAWRVGSGCKDGPLFSETRSIWSAPWTAAVFRAELFHKTGLLEEMYESYLEDVDFGLRCASLQLAGEYRPEALAWHRGSATLGRWNPHVVRRIARNQVLLIARHYSWTTMLRCAWPIVVAQSLWGIVALRHGAGFAWLRGKYEGILNFAKARKSRQPHGRAKLHSSNQPNPAFSPRLSPRPPRLRSESPDAAYPDAPELIEQLREWESEIYHIQGMTRVETYWRLYFLFT